MKTLLLKSLIAAALFLGFSAITLTSGTGYDAKANSLAHHFKGHVSEKEVIIYLEEAGYLEVRAQEELENGNWLATGWSDGMLHHIIVFVDGDQIIGHEDQDQ
jgi:hypothetical protein